MVKKIKLDSAQDLKEFMQLAWECKYDIGVHTDQGQIADAKSILGLIALNYDAPVMVVTENDEFFNQLEKWSVD